MISNTLKHMVGLGILSLGLVGCSFKAGLYQYQIHDVLFYGDMQTRVTWLYGVLSGGIVEQSVKVGNQTLVLRDQFLADLYSIGGTLSVNGKSFLKGSTLSIGQPLNVSSALFGGGYFLQSQIPLKAVFYTDGRNWFKLSGPVEANVGLRVVPQAGGLRGGDLTDIEAGLLQARLSEQAPLVVGIMADNTIPDAPYYSDPAPLSYHRTGLVVQKGIPLSLSLANTSAVTNRDTYTVLRQDSYSGYDDNFVQARLSGSYADFLRVWSMANQNLSPVPSTPNIDFSRQQVASFFMGLKNTGGYAVSVLKGQAQEDSYVLTVQLSTPAPKSITTQALSSPWLSVALDGQFQKLIVRDQDGALLAETNLTL